MADLTIRHTHAEGTLLTGSTKGDGVWEIVRGRGFTYFRSMRVIGIRGSRDRDADMWRIERAKEALESAGHTVTVDIDDQWRPPQEREADLAARSEERADRYAERAGRRWQEGEARKDSARKVWDSIPFGQPILVGHHSEKADRNRRERAHNNYGKGIELQDEARELDRRSHAAEVNQRYRHSPRTIIRRIEGLCAEVRRFERSVARGEKDGYDTPRARREIARLTEDIAYWQERLKASGFLAWGPEHFRVGDLALVGATWYTVVRVNRKSLSVPPLIGLGASTNGHTGQPWSYTDTVPYDKVFGRMRDGRRDDSPPAEDAPTGQ